jgi:aminoglycoside phosphotransferase (APT) family kinase protein
LIHGDLYWTNVIFRDGLPVALIDWELARPASAVLEVGMAATYWAGLRIDEQLVEWGIPLERRGERLRLLCDAYGLDAEGRSRLFDELNGYRRERIAAQAYRGTVPVEVIHANLRWTEEHAAELSAYLV